MHHTTHDALFTNKFTAFGAQAFWMFVVICEEILAKDFFCAPRAALNGAMVEGRVVEAIILDEWGDQYASEELKQVCKLLTVKLGESSYPVET